MVFGELDPPPGSITEFDPPPGLDLPPMFREIHAVGRRSSNLRPAAKSFLQVLRDVAG
jgi:hypothetical protein